MAHTTADSTPGLTGRHDMSDAPYVAATREHPLGAALSDVWTEFRGLVRDHAALAVLEAQRAGIHFAYLIAAVLVVSVLAVTAWLALVTALIVWLVGAAMSWPWVLVIGASLNIAGAVGIVLWVRQRALEVPFAATLRQLQTDRSRITGGDGHAPGTRP